MNIEELVRYIKGLMTGRKEHIPLEIAGALLFGSWSQGSQGISSDADLLVVAENINPKRHRRGTEIALIKRYFAYTVDSGQSFRFKPDTYSEG